VRVKVLLVRPAPPGETIGLQHLMVVEPLELEVLAAQLRPPDSAALWDGILDEEPLEAALRRERPDVLAVTGYITHVGVMKDACRLARRIDPRVRTVAGGVHCEVCPEDLDDPAVDLRVVRNAATSFGALVEHLRGAGPLPPGVLRAGERASEVELPPLDFRFPRPDRSLTARHRDRYFYVFHDRVALLKTAFGCPYRCAFCFCREITGGRYHPRPLDEVLAELGEIREREIYVVDDDFLVDPERVGAFADASLRRGLDKRYLVYGRADFVVRHPEVVRRFRDAGLDTVIVGFESFSDEDLARYHKGIDAETNRRAMRVLSEAGVDCYATVIVPPHWGREDFRRCGDELVALGVRYVNLQPLTPLPGTGFAASPGELLLDRADHARWDLAHVALRPTRLSVPDFYRAVLALYDRVLFRPGVLAGHVRRHRLAHLWRMALGAVRVRRQYGDRIREAARA
jgi:radical SAM superfamily enzyme YgiQ (UPF0313 family)